MIDNKDIEVFLGGTTNKTKWRDELIPLLDIKYFNPVVDNWNEEAQQTEIEKRETCDYVLYVITPKMKGVYSIAEVVEDSIKRPNKTLFCYLNNYDNLTFDEHQIKSLEMTKLMIENNGAKTFNNIYDIVTYLNEKGAQY